MQHEMDQPVLYAWEVRFRVTGWVCEKIAQNAAQTIFCHNKNIASTMEKVAQTFWATIVIF
jgi:hypothetical protein